MTSFDETYTDSEFVQELARADSDWMKKEARNEPDLDVEGLDGSLFSRVLHFFTGRSR